MRWSVLTRALLAAVLWTAGAWLGPVAWAEIQVGVTSQVEYNDNLFLEPSGGSSDVLFRLLPWMDVAHGGHRHSATLSYRPSYTWYRKNPELDQAGHEADLEVAADLSRRVDLLFNTRLERSEEGTSDQQPVEGTSRLPVTNLSSSLSVHRNTGRDEFFDVTCTGRSLDYDSRSVSEDSREVEGEFALRTMAGDHRAAILEGRYAKGWYDTSASYRQGWASLEVEQTVSAIKRLFGKVDVSTYTSDGRTDYLTVNPYAGLAGEWPHGRYDLGAGVLIRDEEGGDTTCEFSLVGTAEIEKTWPRGSLTASLETGHDEDYIDFDTPGFTTYATGLVTGSYLPVRGWSLDGQCEVRGDDYQENRPAKEDRRDVTVTLTGGIQRQIRKWGVARLEGSHRVRRSTLNDQEYDENSITLTFNVYTR